MGSKQSARRRWLKQLPPDSELERATAVSDEGASVAGEKQIAVGSLTQKELQQVISDAVERALEEHLPKQLARQRIMMETELKWHLNDIIREAVVTGNVGAAADAAPDEPESEETPKLNTSIDWSFLE